MTLLPIDRVVVHCILETSNFVLIISSSESNTGSAASAIAAGMLSSTHFKFSSSVVGLLAFGFGELLLVPRIFTPYASETNCSSSSSSSSSGLSSRG